MARPLLFELGVIQRWHEEDKRTGDVFTGNISRLHNWVVRSQQNAIVGKLPCFRDCLTHKTSLVFDDEKLGYLRELMTASSINVAHVCTSRALFRVDSDGIGQAWPYWSAPKAFTGVPPGKPLLIIEKGADLGEIAVPILNLKHDAISPNDFLAAKVGTL